MTLDALARSYDHVVVDAGAVSDAMAAHLSPLLRRAVLIAADAAATETAAAQDQLRAAGFTEVTLLVGAPIPVSRSAA
jgi:hypothetical protein